MSKEIKSELLKKNSVYMCDNSGVQAAMDEFAEIRSIAFAEWISENDYWCKQPNTVTNLDGNKIPFTLWYKHGQSVGGIRTEHLYEKFKLYLQSIKG